MNRSHTHVVYGFPVGVAPVGDPAAQGYGRSDRAALADARRQHTGAPLVWYFIRSNGTAVPAGPTAQKNPAAVALGRRGGQAATPAKQAAARVNGRTGGRPRKPSSAVAWRRGPLGWSALINGVHCSVSRYRTFFPIPGRTAQRTGWSYVGRPAPTSPPPVFLTLRAAQQAVEQVLAAPVAPAPSGVCPLCGQAVTYSPGLGGLFVAWHQPPAGATTPRLGTQGDCFYSGTVL